MDPYDLPEEFSHLQAQDMSKLGFMQDLIRGINKIAKVEKPEQGEAQKQPENKAINPLLDRAFIFIEDGDFESGNEYCEKVLDEDPRCGEAYLAKLMMDMKVKNRRDLATVVTTFEDNVNYKRILRFGSEALIDEVKQCLEEAYSARLAREEKQRIEQQRIQEEREEAARRENLIRQYNSIPSTKQLRETVKKRGGIKALKVAAVIFLVAYWPIAIILFVLRNILIKKSVKQENSKYDYIRSNYEKMRLDESTRGPQEFQAPQIQKSVETFELTVKQGNHSVPLNPDVMMKMDERCFAVKKDQPTIVPMSAGTFRITFAFLSAEKEVIINMNQNITIQLTWDAISCRLDAKIFPTN